MADFRASARVGTSATRLVDEASAIAKPGKDTKSALENLGSFLAKAMTSGYPQRQLARDLPDVSKNAIAVLGALSEIVRIDYAGSLLTSERQKLTDQYREFEAAKRKTAPLSVEAQLALYDRWRTDDDAIAVKRAAALKFAAGLDSMSKGLANLAANADKLSAKELFALLEPYASELETLIPAIQKAL